MDLTAAHGTGMMPAAIVRSFPMLLLIPGLILFLGAHSLSIFAPAWRDATVARLGERAWKVRYSLVSLAGLILIVWGYSLARHSPVLVYVPPVGLRALAPLVTLPVFPFLLAAYVPGKIRGRFKHPMLVAVRLWAAAHLLANGMLADIALFGSLFVWATVLQIALKSRPSRPAPVFPFKRFNDASAIIVGVVIYLFIILFLHRLVLGVSPIT